MSKKKKKRSEKFVGPLFVLKITLPPCQIYNQVQPDSQTVTFFITACHSRSRKLTDTHKKLEQSRKDAEFYHRESESLRARYNDVVLEKQRCQQENESLRIYMEEERKEVTDLRRQQQVRTRIALMSL